jgi:glycosyltransferase involved in cell wall biosynthesis
VLTDPARPERLRIAMIGTRGVPARYGGFETAVEEIGRRLVGNGHEVVVYCRTGRDEPRPSEYLGMRLVHLPAIRSKTLETLCHTALSVLQLIVGSRRFDAAIVFNAANAPFLPALRLRRVPVAVHVDGLEWKRAKWGGAGRHYYRAVEALAVRWADALIADAQGIADYYTGEFGADTELLTYGAPVQTDPGADRLAELDLAPLGYHLVVARFEPENHVAEIVAGYHDSTSRLPLVVVGSAPYSDTYTAHINAIAHGDSRIRVLGGIWDQEQLDQLYANALTYLHGHSVGGTNPSLLRALGAGTAVIAYDVDFNREVLGGEGRFFVTADDVSMLLDTVEANPEDAIDEGRRLQKHADAHYRWDDVTDGYAALLTRLRNGFSQRGRFTGRRSGATVAVESARSRPAEADLTS